MQHNILITGGSGYLGGTLLSRLSSTISASDHKFFALIRTNDQARAVERYGTEPIAFNPYNEEEVKQAVLKHQINIVFFLIDAAKSIGQVNFIKALNYLKQSTGRDVHFLHVSYLQTLVPASKP